VIHADEPLDRHAGRLEGRPDAEVFQRGHALRLDQHAGAECRQRRVFFEDVDLVAVPRQGDGRGQPRRARTHDADAVFLPLRLLHLLPQGRRRDSRLPTHRL